MQSGGAVDSGQKSQRRRGRGAGHDRFGIRLEHTGDEFLVDGPEVDGGFEVAVVEVDEAGLLP